MGVRKCIAVAVLLFLPVIARGQNACQPSNQPTMSATPTLVDPSQVPFAAVTTNVSASDGSQTSHSITVGSGTTVKISWQTYNAASFAFYWSLDNGSRSLWGSNALSGSFLYTMQSWQVGHVFHIYAVATEKSGSGSFSSTTQDVASITTTSQGPGIYSSDGIASNLYALVQGNYGGTPNIDTNACPNAYQKPTTPTAQLQLTNVTSGEQRNQVNMNGATTACCIPLSASAYDYISVLPGDTIKGSVGGVTYCTAIGNIWVGNLPLGINPAWTKFSTIQSSCKAINPGNPGVKCNVTYQYMCSTASKPPDWKPATIYSKYVQDPALMPPFWWGFALGIRYPDEDGVPWLFPANDIAAILSTDYWVVKVLTAAFPSNSTIRDCTVYDKGITPTPWPPFDH